MYYKNSEGYPDPTAGIAIAHIAREERQKKRKAAKKSTNLQQYLVISLSLENLIILKPYTLHIIVFYIIVFYLLVTTFIITKKALIST